MQNHELKCWSDPFWRVARGVKRYEVRPNDRGFRVGDWLILKEYDPEMDQYSGNMLRCRVEDVLEGGQFGIESGYVVMSIAYVHWLTHAEDEPEWLLHGLQNVSPGFSGALTE